MMQRDGDVAGARAAAEAGTIFTLSSMSGHSIEEVGSATATPKWFQLYFLGGRQGAEQLIDRAQRAGYHALVVTLDTQIAGNRERDLRHGIKPPLKMTLANAVHFAPQVAARPAWLLDFARDHFQLDIVNTSSVKTNDGVMSVDEALTFWGASPPKWADFSWIREQWRGPIVAKGILTAVDAKHALDAGADAIVISNHGGRQLDGVPAPLRVLPEIVDAVGRNLDVLVDGGIRRGSDAIRAIALGAKAVMVGRAWAYGLAANGEAGVAAILEILRADLDRTLRLLGCESVADLNNDYVDARYCWKSCPKTGF
jgi:isopentenyl diphosphate isomerase/L-lactate dehydrogenase-like FMN-dependent dehydrogenase